MRFGPSQGGVALLALCSIFELLAITAVGLRLWSRKIKKVGLFVNDYAILVALVRLPGFIRRLLSLFDSSYQVL